MFADCIGLYWIILLSVDAIASSSKHCLRNGDCTDEPCLEDGILSCKHGRCNGTTNECDCQPCWSGEYCDVPVNRHMPVFSEAYVDVKYGANSKGHVTTVKAHDADQSSCDTHVGNDACPCGTIAYTIVDGNDDSAFLVDPGTGTIRLDFGHITDFRGSRKIRVAARNPSRPPDNDNSLSDQEGSYVLRVHSQVAVVGHQSMISGKNDILREPHGRRKRESSNPVVDLYPVHGSQVVIGGPVSFILEVVIPGSTASTIVVDLKMPLMDNGDPAMDICSARMFFRGENMPLVTEVTPTYFREDGLITNKATFEFGEVINLGVNQNATENTIKLSLSAVLRADIPGITDVSSLDVVAEIRYQNITNDSLRVATTSIIPVLGHPTENTEAQTLPELTLDVQPEGVTTLRISHSMFFTFVLTVPPMSAPFSFNVTMPMIGGDALLSILNWTMISTGSNFVCRPMSQYQTNFKSEQHSYYTSASVDFGVIMNNGLSHVDQFRRAVPADDELSFTFEVRMEDHPSLVANQPISFVVQLDFGSHRQLTQNVTILVNRTGLEKPILEPTLTMGETTNLNRGETIAGNLIIKHEVSSQAYAHSVVVWFLVPSYIRIDSQAMSLIQGSSVEVSEEGTKFKFDKVVSTDTLTIPFDVILDPSSSVPSYQEVVSTTMSVELVYHRADGLQESGAVRLAEAYSSTLGTYDLSFSTSPLPRIITYYERGYLYDTVNRTLFICMSSSSSRQECSSSNDLGASWRAIDRNISTINYIDRVSQRLYGLTMLGKHIMISDDLGQTWTKFGEPDPGTVSSLDEVTLVPSIDRIDKPELDAQVITSGHTTTDCGVYCSIPSRKACYNRLNVVEDPDIILSASSTHSSTRIYKAGLFHVQDEAGYSSWAARILDSNQWIQADLGYPRQVTGVLFRGRATGCCNQWVTEFKVQYSIDEDTFYSTQTFPGTSDKETVHVRYFDRPVFARYFRINPISWYGHISVRFDLIGCPNWS